MGLFSKAGQPIIYKESSDAKEYLERLEELYLKAEGPLKDEIDKEMKIVKAGIVGEEQILYELKNSGMDMYVLHDIFLESGESSAQIDFYVITPQMTFNMRNCCSSMKHPKRNKRKRQKTKLPRQSLPKHAPDAAGCW